MSRSQSSIDEPRAAPKWETAVLIVSFLAVWVWYFARESATRAGGAPSPLLNLVLLGAIPLLVWVLIRRMRRTVAAMRAAHPAQRGRADRN